LTCTPGGALRVFSVSFSLRWDRAAGASDRSVTSVTHGVSLLRYAAMLDASRAQRLALRELGFALVVAFL
jgi:hypothetical protein